MMKTSLVTTVLLLTASGALAQDAINCSSCAEWNKPVAPFNIHGNTWYVGTAGLSALLVTSPQGHVLLDGALPQSAPLIQKNIEALGFKMKDVKLILNSHAHFDHAGGIAALQKASGATVAHSPHGAQVLRDGTPGTDDPQYDPKERFTIPKVAQVKEVADGETLAVGPLRFTVHYTPGHTPGGTTWTWQSCEAGKCLDMVYADSLTAVSTDGFYYTGGANYPDRSASFRKTIDTVAGLKCDIVVAAHPSATDAFAKAAAKTAQSNPFIDPEGCRKLAAGARKNFEARLQREAAEKAKAAGG
ncbi:subclass B3 metallo-beta-lactamase [Massilia sp. IC2-477]|uniref:subclass B3 metallo-beta-lactamase n=1 Tax=Massilia sp. IC2-477 TaxID=2887198 RepID=UPI001D11E689|nr:subclass B3 metallo-beta-lactamase [Massilia sp. IC2-477]MCC2957863.1 subclass B3 metallo-beta-lactamase [Massilia sp. IC2-477]